MSIGGWVAIVVLSLVFGSVAFMFIVCGVDFKHKFWGATIVLLLGAMMFIGLVTEAKVAEDAWNGGHCECGGTWELRGVTKSRNGTVTKYYVCDECRHEITQ